MSAYLYPNLKSKRAYRDALNNGEKIIAMENTPMGPKPITDGKVTFEGPHYPQPHRFYGSAMIVYGVVIWIK